MNTEAFKIFSFEQTRDSSTYIERIGEPCEFHAVGQRKEIFDIE